MLTLVPNNTTRVAIAITEPNAAGVPTAVTGLTVTARLADDATATSALLGLSYTCTEYTGLPGTYYVDLPGADIAQLAPTHYNTGFAIQFIQGTSIAGYIEATLKPTRRISG